MPNTSKILAENVSGQQVWMTQEQFDALETLEQANRGGCAAVKGYVPSTGWIKRPTKDIQMLTRFSYTKLLERKRDALEAINFSDVQPHLTNPKLEALSLDSQSELFEQRKQQELESIDKTLDGVRDDAHRKGHDRCYIKFAEGVKVNLVTEKRADGKKHPVLTQGYPTVQSIMVQYLELNSKTVVEGERKIVNSGASVLMRNAINKVLNQRSVGIRSVSLKDDNFERLTIAHNVLLPESVQGLVENSSS